MDKIYENDAPAGYADAMERFNRPGHWNVAAIIEDMKEMLKTKGAAPDGELLAAMDWMTTRLQDCRDILIAAREQLEGFAYVGLADKDKSKKIAQNARQMCEVLEDFKA